MQMTRLNNSMLPLVVSSSDFLQQFVTSNHKLVHVYCISAELNKMPVNRVDGSESKLCCQVLE